MNPIVAEPNVLLVDPSLFTAPYDAALTGGLRSLGVEARWATRPTRAGDRQEIPLEVTAPFFYRRVDGLKIPSSLHALLKGLAHGLGLVRLLGKVRRERVDVLHFQWAVVPVLDAFAMWIAKRRCPVVLTVHDTIPYNGQPMNVFQRVGYLLPMEVANRLIVHTQAGRERLVGYGLPAHKIVVVAHGPLRLAEESNGDVVTGDSRRWTFVLFGEIKPYKGLDLLVEAFASLDANLRDAARIIVAGRPRMDLTAVHRRIAALGSDVSIELRPERLTEPEMARLFEEADCFVFPYRQVDASGVYFLVKGRKRWLIATNVGVFAEDLAPGRDGELVEPNVTAIAAALARAIRERPMGASREPSDEWTEIARRTLDVYRSLTRERRATAAWPAADPAPR